MKAVLGLGVFAVCVALTGLLIAPPLFMICAPFGLAFCAWAISRIGHPARKNP